MLKVTSRQRFMKQVFKTRTEDRQGIRGAVTGATTYDILNSKPLDYIKDSSFHIHALPEQAERLTPEM